uniref:Variant surface glycoprotein 809 n=1 Tax=Trypanosoma brucei TaxID=5691 RepID=M4T2E2_9TRYP|nr:variant surface glycoprotein 809 [Trypanosoma brucei]
MLAAFIKRQQNHNWWDATGRSGHVCLLILPLLVAPTTANLHPTKPAVTKPCQAADYLNAIAGNALELLTTATEQVANTLQTEAKLDTIAASESAAKQLTAALIAIELRKKALETLTEVQQSKEAIVKGALAAAMLSGSMETIADLQPTTVKTHGRVATVTAQSDNTYLKAEPQLSPSNNGACYTTANAREPFDGQPEAKASTTNKIVLIGLEAVTVDNSRLTSPLTVCWSSSGVGAYSSSDCASTQSTSATLVGGPIFKTKTITVTRDTAQQDSEYAADHGQTVVPSQSRVQRKLKEIACPEKAAAKLTKLTIGLELKPLITSSVLKQQIAKAIDGDNAKYSNQETKTKVDNLIKEAIGENGDEIKNTVGKSLDELTPPKAAVGGNGDKQLKAITSPQDIAAAATYYTVQRFVEEQEKKKKNQANPSCPTKTDKSAEPPKTADECKKHLTEKPCKDEKGCDFDDKKPEGERCFPKAETDKKDLKSFSRNLTVSFLQAFAAIALAEFYSFKKITSFYEIYEIC